MGPQDQVARIFPAVRQHRLHPARLPGSRPPLVPVQQLQPAQYVKAGCDRGCEGTACPSGSQLSAQIQVVPLLFELLESPDFLVRWAGSFTQVQTASLGPHMAFPMPKYARSGTAVPGRTCTTSLHFRHCTRWSKPITELLPAWQVKPMLGLAMPRMALTSAKTCS